MSTFNSRLVCHDHNIQTTSPPYITDTAKHSNRSGLLHVPTLGSNIKSSGHTCSNGSPRLQMKYRAQSNGCAMMCNPPAVDSGHSIVTGGFCSAIAQLTLCG